MARSSTSSLYRSWSDLRQSGDQWTLGIVVVSFLVALIIAVLKFFGGPGGVAAGQRLEPFPDVAQTFILTVYAVLGFGFIIRCWARLGETKKTTQELKESIDNQALLASLTTSLIQSHEIIRNVGLDTLRSQLKSMRPMERGFAISGTNWAMRANANFWREICRYALDTSRPGNVVKVIHSGDPREWFDSEALASLNQQKRFCDLFNPHGENGNEQEFFCLITKANMSTNFGAKNTIERIIVGKSEIDKIEIQLRDVCNKSCNSKNELISDILNKKAKTTRQAHQFNSGHINGINEEDELARAYADVMRLMCYYGISVYYAVGEDEDFGSDFALFKTDGRDLVMEWEHTHHVGAVAKCNFYDEAPHRFAEKYEALHLRATPLRKLLPPQKNDSQECKEAALAVNG